MDRLFFKYLAPFLAISIIPTLAIVLILFFFIRNNITELEDNLLRHDTETLSKIVADKNEAIAQMEGFYIEREIENVQARLTAMQLHPDFINMETENINAYAENLFAQDASIMELTVIDRRGDMIYQKFSSLSLELDEPINMSTEEVFHELEKKAAFTSPIEISNITQLPFVTLGQPILDNAGSFAGGIIVKLDLKFINEIVSSKKFGDGGYMFLVSKRGQLIAHPSMKEFYQNPDYTRYEYINDIVRKKNGTLWSEDNLISFSTNKFGWATIVLMPASEALASVEHNKQTILSFINATLQSIAYFTVLIILFGFLIAIAATIFISKRIIGPVLNFTNATRRISEGELSLKIEKQSNDEIGELTDSFNKMTEELKKEREELIKSNEFIKKQAEEIISQHLLSKEQNASQNISELEKPFNRLKIYLREMKEQGNGKSEQVSEVLNDIEQIDAFMKDLFEHSNITPNVRDFTPVDFLEAFKSAMEKLQGEIKKTNASIRCTPLPNIKALRSSIVQLFENLLSNAIKYKSERPVEIVVSAEDKGSEWQFTIRDNGTGIPQDEAADIFHVREKRVNGHSKLNFGLALCKNIVERHGGKIWVESQVGRGSSFYFTVKKY